MSISCHVVLSGTLVTNGTSVIHVHQDLSEYEHKRSLTFTIHSNTTSNSIATLNGTTIIMTAPTMFVVPTGHVLQSVIPLMQADDPRASHVSLSASTIHRYAIQL
jgi:hypothetical protein